jgi:anti-anti-sigma factor
VNPERTSQAIPIEIIVRESDSGALTLQVRGELDSTTASHLRAALDGAEEVPELVIDLSKTSFGDLRGVRELVRCARRRRARRSSLVVLAPPTSVERILRMTPLGHELWWQPRGSRPRPAR